MLCNESDLYVNNSHEEVIFYTCNDSFSLISVLWNPQSCTGAECCKEFWLYEFYNPIIKFTIFNHVLFFIIWQILWKFIWLLVTEIRYKIMDMTLYPLPPLHTYISQSHISPFSFCNNCFLITLQFSCYVNSATYRESSAQNNLKHFNGVSVS